ncbi:MAG TPA: hypothetical protein VG101_00130 [Puia sp.]|jgi:hypothetical protein|nr:hypothetical protein [Puia sp.]
MKLRALLILLVLVVAMLPVYYMNRWMRWVMRPRESAGRLFLFLLANFVLIIVYTMLLVGMIVRIFPTR